MQHRQFKHVMALLALWGVGIGLALGSRSYDPDVVIELPPITVTVDLNNSGNIVYKNGESTDTLTDVGVSASYEKSASARISMRAVPVTLEIDTTLTATIEPEDPNDLLTGEVVLSVVEALEFGVNRVPEQGQLSILFGGTSTLVSFDGDANNVVVQVGTTTQPVLTFANFRARFVDIDLNVNERAASKAYRLLENIWQLTRITETVQTEVDDQLDVLEAMGQSQALALTCDNLSSNSAAQYALTWDTDATGTGAGSAGNGDSFFASWSNCELSADQRFLERDLTISNYQFANEVTPRSLSYNAELGTLFVATESIDAAVAALDRDRITGILSVFITEVEATQ